MAIFSSRKLAALSSAALLLSFSNYSFGNCELLYSTPNLATGKSTKAPVNGELALTYKAAKGKQCQIAVKSGADEIVLQTLYHSQWNAPSSKTGNPWMAVNESVKPKNGAAWLPATTYMVTLNREPVGEFTTDNASGKKRGDLDNLTPVNGNFPPLKDDSTYTVDQLDQIDTVLACGGGNIKTEEEASPSGGLLCCGSARRDKGKDSFNSGDHLAGTTFPALLPNMLEGLSEKQIKKQLKKAGVSFSVPAQTTHPEDPRCDQTAFSYKFAYNLLHAFFKNTVGHKNKFNIKLEKLRYWSVDQNGDAIILSGLMMSPAGSTPSGIVINFHGSIDRSSAPSKPDIQVAPLMLLASEGNLVLLPDNLGHGDTQTAVEPYLLSQLTAVGAYDMLAAARGLLGSDKTLPVTLIGASQGGHSAAAMLAYMGAHEPTQPRTLWAAEGPYAIDAMARAYMGNVTGAGPSLDPYFGPALQAYPYLLGARVRNVVEVDNHYGRTAIDLNTAFQKKGKDWIVTKPFATDYLAGKQDRFAANNGSNSFVEREPAMTYVEGSHARIYGASYDPLISDQNSIDFIKYLQRSYPAEKAVAGDCQPAGKLLSNWLKSS